MLFNAPEPDFQEEAVISRIEEIRKQLSYSVSSRRWTGNLSRMAFARAVQGSNSIEGYRVSVEDALAAVDSEEPHEAQRDTWLAVLGYRQAMSYVLQLSDDPHFSYSRGMVKGLHYMMLAPAGHHNPGKWRPGPIYVRNELTKEIVYEGPVAEGLNDLMHELVEELNRRKGHCLIRAAMAHLNLVMIHPFSDGNGRMGRCLQTLVLVRDTVMDRNFCSIEEYLGHKQQAYYDVLADVGQGAWHPERDARPWIRFCLTAHYRQAQNFARMGRIFHRLWDALEYEVRKRGLPDRLMSALSDAALGLRVRNATYRKGEAVSLALAGRDLKSAAEAGLLVAHGEKRGRLYVASDDLVKIGRDAHEPYREEDPFEPTNYLPGLRPL